MHGSIFAKWDATGRERGPRGYPISDEHDTTDGRSSQFQDGAIYAYSGGVFKVYGNIWHKYEDFPGFVGLPVSDQEPISGGRGNVQDFGDGHIYDWSRGLFAVYSEISKEYDRQKREQGCLGLPTSDPMLTSDYQYLVSYFEHGKITLDHNNIGKTFCPPGNTTVNPPSGFSAIAIWNCNDDYLDVTVYLSDHSNPGWQNKGSLSNQWSGGSCPNNSQPLLIQGLETGHVYDVRATDPGHSGCPEDDPTNLDCDRFDKYNLVGDSNGPVYVAHVQ